MAVKYWETRNDINHSNKHAMVEGTDIEFFAFPWQPYLGRCRDLLAIVTVGPRACTAILETCLPDGRTEYFESKSFPGDQRDAVFEWAAQRMLEEEQHVQHG